MQAGHVQNTISSLCTRGTVFVAVYIVALRFAFIWIYRKLIVRAQRHVNIWPYKMPIYPSIYLNKNAAPSESGISDESPEAQETEYHSYSSRQAWLKRDQTTLDRLWVSVCACVRETERESM